MSPRKNEEFGSKQMSYHHEYVICLVKSHSAIFLQWNQISQQFVLMYCKADLMLIFRSKFFYGTLFNIDQLYQYWSTISF